MNLEQVRYFIEISRTEHMGKAARALHLSPSALSHSISQLESELGQKLLIRQGRRVFLSEHGHLLAQKGSDLLERFSDLRETLSTSVDVPRLYRFAATHGLGELLVIPAWAAFHRENPSAQLEFVSLRSSQVLEKAITGEIDLGFCLSPRSHPKIQIQPLKKGELKIVVRKGHPVLKLSVDERAKKLNEYPSSAPKAFQGIDNCETHPVFKSLKIYPKVDFIFDNYALSIEYLLKSNAWALIPDIYLENQKNLISVFNGSIGAPYELSRVWPTHRPIPQMIQKFLRFLEK